MEYHVPQLVDVCATLVGVRDLDAASTPPLRHALLTLHPVVWPWPLLPALHLGYGPGARAAQALGLHEPETDGTQPSPVSLPTPGSHGEGFRETQLTLPQGLSSGVNHTYEQ